MADPIFVRVKDKSTKHEYSVVESAVSADFHTVLDKPATQADGRVLPPKHHVPLSGSQSGQPADTASRKKD